MMTLWCIFRSPLMVGAELTKLDDWTLSLLTNREVLSLWRTAITAFRYSGRRSTPYGPAGMKRTEACTPPCSI